MNILDENIPANQRQLLELWGIPVRQVGLNVGWGGMQDDEIPPLLLQQRRPTFFTRDEDFHDRRLCHTRYCLVYLAVDKHEVAAFVRRLLRHSACRTQVQRMGTVIRVSRAGLSLWRLRVSRELALPWD